MQKAEKRRTLLFLTQLVQGLAQCRAFRSRTDRGVENDAALTDRNNGLPLPRSLLRLARLPVAEDDLLLQLHVQVERPWFMPAYSRKRCGGIPAQERRKVH